jgi:mRNA interferase YafQ
MRLKRHKNFIKDYNKTRLTDGQFEKMVSYLNALREELPLPPESKDHSLEGNYADCREFHLGGDMLLIYLVEDGAIILLRLGTHSQLFS